MTVVSTELSFPFRQRLVIDICHFIATQISHTFCMLQESQDCYKVQQGGYSFSQLSGNENGNLWPWLANYMGFEYGKAMRPLEIVFWSRGWIVNSQHVPGVCRICWETGVSSGDETYSTLLGNHFCGRILAIPSFFWLLPPFPTLVI